MSIKYCLNTKNPSKLQQKCFTTDEIPTQVPFSFEERELNVSWKFCHLAKLNTLAALIFIPLSFQTSTKNFQRAYIQAYFARNF
jgi:hypothetical protein